MDKERFVKIMSSLGKMYQVEIDKEMLELWLAFFKDENTNDFANAVNEYIRTRTTFPTAAHIKKYIVENKMKDFPKAEDEWNRVLELVSKYGTYRELDALNEMKDYTRYIVKHIGFVNICMADSEQQKWNRKEFIEEYSNLKDRQKELIQIGHKEVNVLKMLQEHNENKELE